MGQPSFNDDERRLFALLPCWMDLVLLIPKNILFISSLHRLQFTSPLVHLILLQSSIYTTKAMFELFEAKHHVVSDHCQVIVNLQESLLPSLSSSQQRSVSFSVELGSSLSEHGFILHKGAFRDALCLGYGWRPPLLPSNCVCNEPFTVEHALSYPRGGLPSIRHNELRDITVGLLSEVCHNVGIEPPL